MPRLRYGVTDRRVVLKFFGVGKEVASKEDQVKLRVAPSSLAGSSCDVELVSRARPVSIKPLIGFELGGVCVGAR